MWFPTFNEGEVARYASLHRIDYLTARKRLTKKQAEGQSREMARGSNGRNSGALLDAVLRGIGDAGRDLGLRPQVLVARP